MHLELVNVLLFHFSARQMKAHISVPNQKTKASWLLCMFSVKRSPAPHFPKLCLSSSYHIPEKHMRYWQSALLLTSCKIVPEAFLHIQSINHNLKLIVSLLILPDFSIKNPLNLYITLLSTETNRCWPALYCIF